MSEKSGTVPNNSGKMFKGGWQAAAPSPYVGPGEGNESGPARGMFTPVVPEWASFTERQKRAFVAANAITIGRPIVRGLVEIIDTSNGRDFYSLRRRVLRTAVHTVLDLGDAADGGIIRRAEAFSQWGKLVDPWADKVDFAIQEVARSARGEIQPTEVGVRVLRDLASMGARGFEQRRAAKTREKAQTQANWPGKMSTATRSATNRLGDLLPKTNVSDAAHHIATGVLVGTLGANIRTYLGFGKRK